MIRRLIRLARVVTVIVGVDAPAFTAHSQPLDTQTDCGLWGRSSTPGVCPANRELYASTCVLACPPGSSRTAACSCQRGTGPTTDCGKYGQSSLPTATCEDPGFSDAWGGLCYTDQCKLDGGSRTASCTCDFGSYGGIETDCGRFWSGDCPLGSHKTAACTCQKGGIVSDCERYGASRLPKRECPADTDEWWGLCYHQKCPEGSRRTASCSCDDLDVETDCSKYGDPKALGDAEGPGCPAGSEYWGGLCYSSKCPVGTTRTASCSCNLDDLPDSECVGGAGGYTGPPIAPSPPLNKTWRVVVHNAYFNGVETGTGDAGSSGSKQHLLDSLYIDRARGLELDLHDADDGWRVYHTQNVGYSLCANFDDCLRVLRAFHYGDPLHDVVFVHLESKEILNRNDFFENRAPRDLDRIVTTLLGDGGRDWVFGPRDFFEWCAARLPRETLDPADLAEAVRRCGWPTMAELRGKFILTFHGGNFFSIDNHANVVHYATIDPIRERKIFPMDGPARYSVFWDIGTDPADPAAVRAFLDANGITRGGFHGDAQFPGQLAGAILGTNGLPDLRGKNLILTDASRSMPSSFTYEALKTMFDLRRCDGTPNFCAGVGLNWSSGCLFKPGPCGSTAFSGNSGYVDGCDPRGLREHNSGIFLAVNGTGHGGISTLDSGDNFAFLARHAVAAEASLQAFVSTRTEASQGADDPSSPFYGRYFNGSEDVGDPCASKPVGVGDLGRTHTGFRGCLMARADVTSPVAPFVAVCRLHDRNSWNSDEQGAYWIVRKSTGDRPTAVYQRQPEDGVGYAEVQNFFRLTHTADGRCWSGFIQSTPDPSPAPSWKELQIGQEECFEQPLSHIGIASDGGGLGGFGSRGDHLFANLKYQNQYVRLVELSQHVISSSGLVRIVQVDERTYLGP